MNYSDLYDDGFLGEHVYGERYIDDYYMDERWKRISDSPIYWVSNKGRLWSSLSNAFIEGTPNIISGHVDIGLRINGCRQHQYLHRLVAEAFVPNPHNYTVVRHLDNDPLNNCADNLAWGTQYDNVQDSIRSGTFRYFNEQDREKAMVIRRTPVVAVRFSDGKRFYFESQQEASRELGIEQSTIHRCLCGDGHGAKGFYFIHDDLDFDQGAFEYSKNRHVRIRPTIRCINIYTGESMIFKSLTEAADELGISISSVSMVLHGKLRQARGWCFEYVDE